MGDWYAGRGRFSSARLQGFVLVLGCVALAAALIDTDGPGSRDAWAIPFASGDIFASVNHGKVQHYDGAGKLLETLETGTDSALVSTAGCAFDAGGNLYVTGFYTYRITRFSGPLDPHSPSRWGPGYEANPDSILFDRDGDAYIGYYWPGLSFVRVDATGSPLGAFVAETSRTGVASIDLAPDGCTMFYTTGYARTVRRFDVCRRAQLPDFASGLNRPSTLRLLPDGGLLVADHDDMLRLDSTGMIVRTYGAPGENSWFALALNPNGKSFWGGNVITGNFYKFDIASGVIELGPIDTGFGSTCFGCNEDFIALCVFGDTSSSSPTTTCTSVRCAFDTVLGSACARDSVPPGITKKLGRAAGFLDRAPSPSTNMEKLHRKAKKALRAAGRAAQKVARGRHPRLSRDCAAAIRATADGIARGL